jgi:hypothetical protein
MELKLQGRRFESTAEIQAESQDVMKMLTQHDFQQCFRSWKSHWDRSLTQKGTTSKEMEANKNFNKWLGLGRRILGTFGQNLVYTTLCDDLFRH